MVRWASLRLLESGLGALRVLILGARVRDDARIFVVGIHAVAAVSVRLVGRIAVDRVAISCGVVARQERQGGERLNYGLNSAE